MSVSNGHSRHRYSASGVVYCSFVVKKGHRLAQSRNSARVMEAGDGVTEVTQDITQTPAGRVGRSRAPPIHLRQYNCDTQTPESEGGLTPGSAADTPAPRPLPTPARRTALSAAPSPAMAHSQSQPESQAVLEPRADWTLLECEVLNTAYGVLLQEGKINKLGNKRVPLFPPHLRVPQPQALADGVARPASARS